MINEARTPVETADPVLLGRQANERTCIDEVTKGLAGRAALVPWLADQPTEAAGLQAMLGDRGQAAAWGLAATVEKGMSPATDENIAIVVGKAQAAC